MIKYILSICLLLSASCLADLACRPDGPVVPRPTSLAKSPTLEKSFEELTSVFDKAVAGNVKAGWAVENASFSLALVSLDQEDPAVPLWEYHHLAEANVNGTQDLDRESQYMIGSVTKLFADMVLLKSDVSLDDPVTNFLPQLGNSTSRIPWQAVTLRSLGSHLSGAPTNYGFSEYAFLGGVFQALGFPPISSEDYPICGVTGLNGGCTKQTLLQGLANAEPVSAVNERPAYSNIAFTLIVLAIEEATGKDWPAQLEDYVAKPLGLRNTFPSPGNGSKAVIPPVENSWGTDYGLNGPGGGLVSTLSDLSAFAHSILSRTALSPSETRAWMKPHALTGSPASLVGMPWEISRFSGLLPDHPSYVANIYAKSGGAYGYRAHVALLDSHGAAFVLLTAGDMLALPRMYDAMLGTLVPALDAVAREQAEEELVTTFASPGCKSSHPTWAEQPQTACVEARLNLSASIELTSLERNGQDILKGLTVLWDNTVGRQLSPIEPKYQLFPTEDTTHATLEDGCNVTREAWRLWFTPMQNESSASDLPGQGIGSQDCIGWTLSDWIHYGGEPVDRVVVVRDAQTRHVIGLEVPFLRSGFLERTSNALL